ncbi:transposase, partial [Streptomyces yerevanensis]|uniref:transposase n=1 Tax=Streptomyces yerevanensis TaxID=66378 RepID=UPI001FDF049E
MPADPVRGRRWADHRGTLEAIAWKYRTNSPWRDLPEELGSFQTAHKRLIRWAVDGTWEKIFAAILAAADAVDDIGWTVVITNRTDTSDQLTNPSKRHALAPMPLPYGSAGWGRLMRMAWVPVRVGWGHAWCSA